ncbi:MAG: MBOAT family protein [Lachnospiraceae bacterium]|nr:MBOAT family protein [Lachnospiraceae bacterium]
MLFNSYIFILFFLPLNLFLYFGLNRIGKEWLAKVILIGMSLWFYAYFHVVYLVIIVFSVLLNYCISKVILKLQQNSIRKVFLWIGLLSNISVIFYFKYFNFFLDNIELISSWEFETRQILLPLGISFFTFQQISYLVDSYKKETEKYTFIDYFLFVTFFPQLVAGPIVLHEEMLPQFNEKKRKIFSHEYFAKGVYLFAMGLFKKVMIADVLGKGVDWGFANYQVLTGLEAVIVSLLYTLQIYFDFSGYCDMAMGIANMFHIDLPLNFNSPYKAVSILDFWQRWHISLTRFLRKYIYFPLGGSRKGLPRTLINVIIVFLVSGIWHGAAWTFVLWGLLHGLANAFCRLFKKTWERVPKILAWLCTFVFLDLTWILFRAESTRQAGHILKTIFSPWEMRVSESLLNCFDLLEFTYVEEHIQVLGNLIEQMPYLHLLIVVILALAIALIPKNNHEKEFKPSVWNGMLTVMLMIWGVFSLSGLSTFLYFNF